jgi:hypothetical protein
MRQARVKWELSRPVRSKRPQSYTSYILEDIMLVNCGLLVHTFVEQAPGRDPHDVNRLLVA